MIVVIARCGIPTIKPNVTTVEDFRYTIPHGEFCCCRHSLMRFRQHKVEQKQNKESKQ